MKNCRAFLLALVLAPVLALTQPWQQGLGPGRAEALTIPHKNVDKALGLMIMVGFRGLELEDDAPILNDIRTLRLGGVILADRDVASSWNIFSKNRRNIDSPNQVKTLIKRLKQVASPRMLLVTIDQEGGSVRRLKPEEGFVPLPSAQKMGQGKPEETKRLARATAEELRDLGINMVLGPVVDVNLNPESPAIGKEGRSFNADPALVVAHGEAFAAALRDKGLLPVLKHFPGHGSAADDSHAGFTDITQTWQRDVELLPYKKMFSNGFSGAILVAHVFNKNLDPDFPASLSHKVITGLLRQDLGWKGVVMSDDLCMGAITKHYTLEEAIYRAVMAGTDILVFNNNTAFFDESLPAKAHATLKRLVKSGKIPEERIWESVDRILAMKTAGGLIR